jgi:SAM-dependent methyltransferase
MRARLPRAGSVPFFARLRRYSDLAVEQEEADLGAARPAVAEEARPTIFHVTHWKAGSQWIYRILRALAPERIVAPRVGEGQFLFAPLTAGGIYPTVYVTRAQFESVALPEGARKFVVIRDLRDTLVSGYFSSRYSHALMTNSASVLRDQLDALSVEDGLLMLMEKWLPSCAAIQASWLESGEPIIRYEDLLARDADILEETLIGHCGLEVTSGRLRQVIAEYRFETHTGGRARGEEDVWAHERKGVAGDWQSKFTPRVTEKFDELYGALLVAGGYERSRLRCVSGAKAAAILLQPDEVVRGYDAVGTLYPNILPLNHWLSWEHAAYRKFELNGRLLDLGCRDGRLFHLLWPDAVDAVGMDRDGGAVEAARNHDIYGTVHQVADYESLGEGDAFDHVFASGTLNFVDDLGRVLAELFRCLRPGGTLLCSVATRHFIDWAMLPTLMAVAGFEAEAAKLRTDYTDYHHLPNLAFAEEWRRRFVDAGFLLEIQIPIMPRFNSGLCLLLDQLWHISTPAGSELGHSIAAYVSAKPKMLGAYRDIIAALTKMETDWDESAGIVFHVRKPPSNPPELGGLSATA